LEKIVNKIVVMAWNLKLLETMRDPSSIVIKTEQLVAVKDKFPKAKHHYLVLPYANIESIFDLTKKDIDLLMEMELLGINVIESTGLKQEYFNVGFHAEPSMKR
jgi:aprataxin